MKVALWKNVCLEPADISPNASREPYPDVPLSNVMSHEGKASVALVYKALLRHRDFDLFSYGYNKELVA